MLRFVVDSSAPVDQAFVDRVTKWAGEKPFAWARYLGTGGGAATSLSVHEADVIHKSGMGIVLVYNDVDRTKLASQNQGVIAAHQAVSQAKALGVPMGTTIYADIEYGWPVTAAWLEGWIAGIDGASLDAGVYVSPGDATVRKAIAGLSAKDRARLSLWYAAWGQTPWDARNGDRISFPAWRKQYPQEVGLWQFAGPSCSNSIDLNLLKTDASPAPKVWKG